jgi:hypothetical protein
MSVFRFAPLVILLIVLASTGHVPWVPVLIAFGVLFAIAPRWRHRHWRRGAPWHGRGAGCASYGPGWR